ncbi:MAG: penicillin-binding protein 1C [Acidobacteria bacterium]|nr:MAG: penicillin-binding protein 1C [Acidobacteriota bacterium]
MRWARRYRVWLGVATAAAGLAAWLRCGALPPGMLDLDAQVSTQVVARDGEPLRESLSADGQRSRLILAGRLPDALLRATLAAEDARFFRHPGLDPLAIARAVVHDLSARRFVEGGSTLTQQVVKVLTRRQRTAGGKLREAVAAVRLEHRLSKGEILALYLSVAPYGNQLQGAEAASRAYFGTGVFNLTPAQAALLAALPQRPTALDPYRHLDAARRRQRWVLERMRALGFLSEDDYRAACVERLAIVRTERAFLAPHFALRVLAEVPGPPPRRLETTLDAALQRDVAGIVDMHRARLLAHGAHNVAVAVLDNRTSEWRAWEGSGDYLDQDHGGAIDGVVSPRQPGSALKPFTYALAFDQGYTPASVLPDLPSHFPTAAAGVLYAPRNYDGVFRGPLRARAALAGSENVPAVWLLSRAGVPDLLRLLRRVGLTTLDKTPDFYGYALTMGDAEVRLDELVAAYGAVARGGVWRRPTAIRRVLRDGGVAAASDAPVREAGERVMSPRAAFWVADVLSDDAARAYVFGRGGSLDFPFPVAVKTGTSQAYHDNWTIGFTRDVTVGVWVGNFDRAPLQNSSGVTGAAPIFHDVLLAAQSRIAGRMPAADEALVDRPADLVPRAICALSGRDAAEFCPRIETEWVPSDRPAASCRWHHRAHGHVAVTWPPAYRAWARQQGLLDPVEATAAGSVRPLEPVRVARPPQSGPLRIVNPPPGAIYLLDPTLRAAFQTLPLRAVAESAAARLVWAIDGTPVGVSDGDRALDWPLARGAHTIAVTDGRERDEAEIVVR